MAGAFTPPKGLDYNYTLNTERRNFSEFFAERAIPNKRANELDLATWNIANLDVQGRSDKDLKLIAHILSSFDITAVQEIKEDPRPFLKVVSYLRPKKFDFVLTDVAGAQERLGIIYRTDRLEQRQLAGELDYNPNGRIVKGKYVISPKKQSFSVNRKKYSVDFYNFNRNPQLTSWKVKGRKCTFVLASAHIYFGKESQKSAQFRNRLAEVFYLATWAAEQRKAKNEDKVFDQNLILLGDMNIPTKSENDPVWRALRRRGLKPTRYSTKAGTTIQEFTAYDQIVFAGASPEVIKINNRDSTVVDFDNFIFRDLWDDETVSVEDFKAFTRYAVSDHRPLFVRLRV